MSFLAFSLSSFSLEFITFGKLGLVFIFLFFLVRLSFVLLLISSYFHGFLAGFTSVLFSKFYTFSDLFPGDAL